MKWISVKDRLPESFVKVVARTFVGDLAISSIQIENVTAANQDTFQITRWEGLINVQVTHWTPLPDPPEGE